MSYGLFLTIFLVPPLVGLALVSRQEPTRLWVAIGVLCIVAVLYTAPWDSAIIRNGVWTYGPRQVLGAVFIQVPLEEYLFYLLQVAMAALLTAAVLRRFGR